jgi:hypothetical protein
MNGGLGLVAAGSEGCPKCGGDEHNPQSTMQNGPDVSIEQDGASRTGKVS